MKVIRRIPTSEALLMRLTIHSSWITDSASIGIPWISLRVSPMRVKRPGRLARCHLRSSMLHSCKMIFTLISWTGVLRMFWQWDLIALSTSGALVPPKSKSLLSYLAMTKSLVSDGVTEGNISQSEPTKVTLRFGIQITVK